MFSPSGALLAADYRLRGSDYTSHSPKINALSLWDSATGNPMLEIEDDPRFICYDISQSDKLLAVGCFGGMIKIWDLKTKLIKNQFLIGQDEKKIFNTEKDNLEAFALSSIKLDESENMALAYMGWYGLFSVDLINQSAQKLIKTPSIGRGTYNIYSDSRNYSYSANGKLIANTREGLLLIDSNPGSTTVLDQRDYYMHMRHYALSADGEFAILHKTRDYRGRRSKFDIEYRKIGQPAKAKMLHFFHTRDKSASSPAHGPYQFKIGHGKVGTPVKLSIDSPYSTFKTQAVVDYNIASLSISNDGKLCIAGLVSGDLVLIDTDNLTEPLLFNAVDAFETSVVSVAISSKKRLIAASFRNHEIIVWSY